MAEQMISESQLRTVCKNIRHLYDAFISNGFVLASFGSTLINHLYLENVSIS